MNARHALAALAAALLPGGAGPFAAEPPDDLPVRRALPVDGSETPVRRAEPVDPAQFENPPWMERVEPAIPVATPVATPAPTPLPTPTPARAPAPQPDPARRAAPAQAAPEDAGTIRLAPTGDVATQDRSLVAGNGFYRREMYEMAIYEYEKFLIANRRAEGRDGALFRLAESHRFLGNDRAARQAYQRLLEEVRDGEFVGAASYRLGEILLAEENYRLAIEMFRRASENAKDPEIRLTAKFFEATALDRLGRDRDALRAFRELAAETENNPFRDDARFYVATLDAKAGRKREAFVEFEELSRAAEKAELQAEATVRAAALAGELGDNERAKILFETALTKPAIGRWRGIAKLGLLRNQYESGDYTQAAALRESDIESLPDEQKAEALLISGNALRMLGKHADALSRYDAIQERFPKSTEAGQARFQRLVCMHVTGAAGLEEEIDRFLDSSSDPKERGQAALLKAEILASRGAHAEAAALYDRAVKARLPKRLAEQAHYKLAWSLAQAGDNAATVEAATKFLETYPKSDLAASALALRGRANQQAQAYAAALQDFAMLADRYPKSSEREFALQQTALIYGQQEKYDEMEKAFVRLLEEYPETGAAAQAAFWTGWKLFAEEKYDEALEHLDRARQLDEGQFGERAALRIMLVHYQRGDREKVTAEVARAGLEKSPSEVVAWLGRQYMDDGDHKRAEQFLEESANRTVGAPANPELQTSIAEVKIRLGKLDEAQVWADRALAAARDPVNRARAMLAAAEIALARGNLADATGFVEEAMLLQPEGRYNAEGRILNGDILMKKRDYDQAARSFLTVAVLSDDPLIAPRALRRAADAYQKAGNSAEAEKTLDELRQRFPESPSESTASQGGGTAAR